MPDEQRVDIDISDWFHGGTTDDSPSSSEDIANEDETSEGDDEMSEGTEGCGKKCCSCQFDAVVEHTFADMMKNYSHRSTRLSDVNDFISTQTQIGHLQEGTKVGTREAAAMQRMDQDKSTNKAMELATAAGSRGGN